MGSTQRVLFELRAQIAKPLHILFEASLENSTLPKDWTDAHISSIYKKGNKKLLNNYRPVSLTSIVCKIMESIIEII